MSQIAARDIVHARLSVRPQALVHRIVFDGRRAVAIEYERGGTLSRAEVRREVVMCAGALETPKLLQLSGIGPGQSLRACGVATIHESLSTRTHSIADTRTSGDFSCNKALIADSFSAESVRS